MLSGAPSFDGLGTVPRSRHWAGPARGCGSRNSRAEELEAASPHRGMAEGRPGSCDVELFGQVEGSTLPEMTAVGARPRTPAGLPRWMTATEGVSGRRLILVCLLLRLSLVVFGWYVMPVMVTELVGSGGLAHRALCLRPVCTVFSPDLWSFFGGGGTCGVWGWHIVCHSSPSQVRTLSVVLFGVGECSVGHGWVFAPIRGSRHDPCWVASGSVCPVRAVRWLIWGFGARGALLGRGT